ncbi:MAG: DUF4835 family protein [Bacteroidales bacterium]|nr:DUF4835 family protein [Bacteroidales bacterium]
MRKNLLICILCLLIESLCLKAQELNCRVQINTDQIGGTDKAVYESFKNNLTEFLNTQHWTELTFGRQEKIDCGFMFIFQKTEDNVHTVELQIQSRRPVFNASYVSPILNLRQSLEFEYQEGQTLEYNPNNISDNLTATIVFWVYFIMGMDFDTFSPKGGEFFFQQAQHIVTQAQGSLGDNWKAHADDNNCWSWMDAITNETQQVYRQLAYQYHRLGLDMMYDNMEEARANVGKALTLLETIKNNDARSPLLSNFSDAKLDEVIQIYSKAPQKEKDAIYDLLVQLYPGQSGRIEAIKEN